ncbi:MAG TPA: hypothetical protein PLK20_05555, partial [Paludibacteraceae bacterium]|nr:hypothetical protein [Paludibacteraceae bacterium]
MKKQWWAATCGLLLSLMSCNNVAERVYNQGINIIPKPKELIEKEGVFVLDGHTRFQTQSEELRP